MATFTVNTAADVIAADGELSLREAVRQANATAAADTIVFAGALEGRTLVLAQGELALTRDVTIDGDRDNDGREVTLSGNDASRILRITGEGTDVRLRDLSLTDGRRPAKRRWRRRPRRARNCPNARSYDGARKTTLGDYAAGSGIYSRGAVTLTNSTVSGNSGRGGIIGTTVTLTDSTVSGNSSGGSGGGILGQEEVTLTNSTVSGNSTTGEDARGGGIFGFYAVTLANSTVSGNSTAGYGADGGGIFVGRGRATIANSIVAGNSTAGFGDDVVGLIASSNGHNIFGSDVNGAINGDLQGVAREPAVRQPSIPPPAAGLNAAGIVPLRNNVTNPALSGGDPLAALPTDQIGTTRPLPAGSLPDIGAAERSQALSTHRLG